MNRKRNAQIVLALVVVGFCLMFAPAAFAQEGGAAAAASSASGLAKMGGAIGAGLAVIGCGLGIGRVAAAPPRRWLASPKRPARSTPP